MIKTQSILTGNLKPNFTPQTFKCAVVFPIAISYREKGMRELTCVGGGGGGGGGESNNNY